MDKKAKIEEASVKEQGKFERKYAQVFEKLVKMPSETQEDKKKRWNFIQELNNGELCYNDFAIDLMLAFQNSAAVQLIRNLGNENKKCVDEGKFDSVAYMEALKESVEKYSEKQVEKGTTFFQYIGENYFNKSKNAKAERGLDSKLSMSDINSRRKADLMRIVWRAKNLKEYNENRTLEDIITDIMKDNKRYSKKDISIACQLAEQMDIVSLDAPMKTGDKEGHTLGDTVSGADKDETNYEVDNIFYNNGGANQDSLEFGTWLQPVIQYMRNNSAEIRNAAGKKAFDLIKAFLTRDILVELKLEEISDNYKEVMKKQLGNEYSKWYQEIKEPRCTSWCHKAKYCKHKERDKGCYKRYAEQPAGDEFFYTKLVPFEAELNKELFHWEYLTAAFDKKMKNLFEIYNEFLSPEFQFTNACMAQCISISEKVISQSKKKFDNETREALYNYCKANLEN